MGETIRRGKPVRPDDPNAVMAHAGRFSGGVALIVLGGPSGQDWQRVAGQVRPDVILTANGNIDLPGAEYWMLTENMHYQWNQAKRGDGRGMEFMRMIEGPHTARFKLISHHSWDLFADHNNCIRIRRQGYELSQIPPDFSFREYGEGYLSGWMFKHISAAQRNVNFHVGTVGLHLLHHAGILGCREVHTIGFDLMIKGERHHWYSHPPYQADRFTNGNMFTRRRYGDLFVDTRWAWVETAQYLKAIEYLFERAGLAWRDHSEGLLKLEGLQCAQ
jgi:hypothetical protein